MKGIKWNPRELGQTLLRSAYLNDVKIALDIRIFLRPTVTDDIACTYGTGHRLTINMDDYQITEFSLGQVVGLLSHEMGVHSL